MVQIGAVRASLSVAAAVAAVAAGAWPGMVDARGPEAGPTANPVVYSPAQATLYTAVEPGFVTRSGATLLLNGQAFHFTGLNIYNANNDDGCWYDVGTAAALNQTLTAIGPGQTVFRAWFFQAFALKDGQRDWSAFDATLAAARAHDERVIATLGNQYRDCQTSQGPRTEGWYRSGYRTAVDAGMIATYRQWVAEVVARYRNNPTILAWQLMNEAEDRQPNGRCSTTAVSTLTAFTQDMAGVVKQIDGNHLLSLGTWGVDNCGLSGSGYQTVHAVGGIDLCEFHDYSAPGDALPQLLQQRLAQCRALGKPLIVGELGVRLQDAGSLSARASLVEAKLIAERSAGVAGSLLWDWCDADQVPYSGYEFQPGDPALAMLSA